jgi:hypothetical protein
MNPAINEHLVIWFLHEEEGSAAFNAPGDFFNDLRGRYDLFYPSVLEPIGENTCQRAPTSNFLFI